MKEVVFKMELDLSRLFFKERYQGVLCSVFTVLRELLASSLAALITGMSFCPVSLHLPYYQEIKADVQWQPNRFGQHRDITIGLLWSKCVDTPPWLALR